MIFQSGKYLCTNRALLFPHSGQSFATAGAREGPTAVWPPPCSVGTLVTSATATPYDGRAPRANGPSLSVTRAVDPHSSLQLLTWDYTGHVKSDVRTGLPEWLRVRVVRPSGPAPHRPGRTRRANEPDLAGRGGRSRRPGPPTATDVKPSAHPDAGPGPVRGRGESPRRPALDSRVDQPFLAGRSEQRLGLLGGHYHPGRDHHPADGHPPSPALGKQRGVRYDRSGEGEASRTGVPAPGCEASRRARPAGARRWNSSATSAPSCRVNSLKGVSSLYLQQGYTGTMNRAIMHGHLWAP
jgi:hypothetical protein